MTQREWDAADAVMGMLIQYAQVWRGGYEPARFETSALSCNEAAIVYLVEVGWLQEVKGRGYWVDARTEADRVRPKASQ